MDIHFGKKIKSLIEKQNLDVKEIAVKLEKAHSSIYKDFQKKDLGTAVLREYCGVLGVDISDLFLSSPSQDQNKMSEELTTYKTNTEQQKNEIDRLNKWLTDREKLIELYEKENKRLQTALEDCLSKLKGGPGQMVG